MLGFVPGHRGGLLLGAGLALLGCRDPVPLDPGPADPPPSLVVETPRDHAVLPRGALRVEVVTAGFALQPKSTETARLPPPGLWTSTAWAHVPGEAPNGYLEYRVDDVVLAEVAEDEVTLDTASFGAGPHTLSITLFYPDGDAFYPPVAASCAFAFAD